VIFSNLIKEFNQHAATKRVAKAEELEQVNSGSSIGALS
jgi:hypothetical protein